MPFSFCILISLFTLKVYLRFFLSLCFTFLHHGARARPCVILYEHMYTGEWMDSALCSRAKQLWCRCQNPHWRQSQREASIRRCGVGKISRICELNYYSEMIGESVELVARRARKHMQSEICIGIVTLFLPTITWCSLHNKATGHAPFFCLNSSMLPRRSNAAYM